MSQDFTGAVIFIVAFLIIIGAFIILGNIFLDGVTSFLDESSILIIGGLVVLAFIALVFILFLVQRFK